MKSVLCWQRPVLERLNRPSGKFHTLRDSLEVCRSRVGWKSDPDWVCPYFNNHEKFYADFPECDCCNSEKYNPTEENRVFESHMYACPACHVLSTIESYGDCLDATLPCALTNCLWFGTCERDNPCEQELLKITAPKEKSLDS